MINMSGSADTGNESIKAKNCRILERLHSKKSLKSPNHHHHHHHHHHHRQQQDGDDVMNDDLKSINGNDYNIDTSKIKLHGIYDVDIHTSDVDDTDPFSFTFQESEETLHDGSKVNVIKIVSIDVHHSTDKVKTVVEVGDVLLKLNDSELLDTPLSYVLELLASFKQNQMKRSFKLLKPSKVALDYFFSQTYLKHEQEEKVKRLQHEMNQLEKVHSFSKGEHHRMIKDSFWSEQMTKRQMKKHDNKDKHKGVDKLKDEQDQLEQFWLSFAESHDELLHKEHHQQVKDKFWSEQMKIREMKSSKSRGVSNDIAHKLELLDDGFDRHEGGIDALKDDPSSSSSQFPQFEMMMDESVSVSVDDESVHTYVDEKSVNADKIHNQSSIVQSDDKVITDESELHRFLENLLEGHHHDRSNASDNAAQWEDDKQDEYALRIDDDDDDGCDGDNDGDNVDENQPQSNDDENNENDVSLYDKYLQPNQDPDEHQHQRVSYVPSEKHMKSKADLHAQYQFTAAIGQDSASQPSTAANGVSAVVSEEEPISSEKRVHFQKEPASSAVGLLNNSLLHIDVDDDSSNQANQLALVNGSADLEVGSDGALLVDENNLMGIEDDLSRLALSQASKKKEAPISKKGVGLPKGITLEAVSENDLFVPTKTWTSTKDARKSNKIKRKSLREKLQSDIFEAVRYGDKKAVEDLLSVDPSNTKAVDFGGTSALHISLMLKDAAIAELLLKKGSPFQKDKEGKDPLQYNKDPKIYKKLKTLHDQMQGLEPVPVPTDRELRYLQLREAAFNGDIEKMKTLLAEDPTCVDDVDDQLQTPLMFACMGQQIEAAMLLINSGADYKATSSTGKTALVYVKDLEANRLLYETAFWASPEGIAYAAYLKEQAEEAERQRLEAERRRLWEEEQERIRQMLLRAEEQKKEREYFTKKSVRSIIKQGSQNYTDFEVSNRLAIDAHNEWIRQQGLQMMEEEKFSRKMWLILDTIEENRRLAEMQRRARLAAEAEAYAAEQARLRALEAEEKRLRELAEARARALQEWKRQAVEEWHVLQAELRKKAWEEFKSKKYIRVAQIKRMYADLKKF